VATSTKTPSNSGKSLVRKRGWPATIETFRTRQDARGWARRVKDEMVRGAYIDRAPSEKTTRYRILLSQTSWQSCGANARWADSATV
jgi:hypothetical protein